MFSEAPSRPHLCLSVYTWAHTFASLASKAGKGVISIFTLYQGRWVSLARRKKKGDWPPSQHPQWGWGYRDEVPAFGECLVTVIEG